MSLLPKVRGQTSCTGGFDSGLSVYSDPRYSLIASHTPASLTSIHTATP